MLQKLHFPQTLPVKVATMFFGFSDFRGFVSAFCQQTFRGFEFAVPAATVANGIMTIAQRSDGTPIAPYLTDATLRWVPNPLLWALFFVGYGLLLIGFFLASMEKGGFSRYLLPRAILHGVLALFYCFVTAAVFTGSEPGAVTTRYVLSAALAVCSSGTLFGIYKSGKRGGNYA